MIRLNLDKGAFRVPELKLKVNEAKSAVARPQSANFSALASPGAERCGGLIAPKALERFKQRIRDITRRAGRQHEDANGGAGPYEFNNPRA